MPSWAIDYTFTDYTIPGGRVRNSAVYLTAGDTEEARRRAETYLCGRAPSDAEVHWTDHSAPDLRGTCPTATITNVRAIPRMTVTKE